MMTLALKPERFHLLDFRSQPITLCGKTLTADQSGAAYWPSQRVLIVADLHLGRPAPSRRMPDDTRQTLLRLVEAIDHYQPEAVIAIGDSLHDSGAAARIRQDDLEILRIMQEDRRWIWITGDDTPLPKSFGGEVMPELTLDGIALRHEPWPARATHEIAGHMHPAAHVSFFGTLLRRPCFVSNGLRLILPTFGAFSGGRNILDDAFGALFGDRGLAVWMLGDEGLYPIAARLLRAD